MATGTAVEVSSGRTVILMEDSTDSQHKPKGLTLDGRFRLLKEYGQEEAARRLILGGVLGYRQSMGMQNVPNNNISDTYVGGPGDCPVDTCYPNENYNGLGVELAGTTGVGFKKWSLLADYGGRLSWHPNGSAQLNDPELSGRYSEYQHSLGRSVALLVRPQAAIHIGSIDAIVGFEGTMASTRATTPHPNNPVTSGFRSWQMTPYVGVSVDEFLRFKKKPKGDVVPLAEINDDEPLLQLVELDPLPQIPEGLEREAFQPQKIIYKEQGITVLPFSYTGDSGGVTVSHNGDLENLTVYFIKGTMEIHLDEPLNEIGEHEYKVKTSGGIIIVTAVVRAKQKPINVDEDW